jgi:two-component system phosphate regulon response regulator PhoB
MNQLARTLPPDSIPPVVLLVDDDPETLDMYSTYFEQAGLWVAGLASADEAVEAVEELKPDAIVTDIGFGGRPEGVAIVHALKEDPVTAAIPLIVLTGRGEEEVPAQTAREADLILIKPVLPDALLSRVRELIARSHELRIRSSAAQVKATGLIEKSQRLLGKSARIAAARESTERSCPSCGKRLEWLERGAISGIEYDYYRWCTNGCGLYCYDRTARAGQNWIKLA